MHWLSVLLSESLFCFHKWIPDKPDAFKIVCKKPVRTKLYFEYKLQKKTNENSKYKINFENQ